MDPSLLSTKLFIPKSRKDLVPRPRLFEKINTGQEKKITLISAPAGFGKSTLLSNWVRQSEEDIVWVSLDESDNGPTRFLTYFIAALNQSDGTKTDFGRGLLSILRSPQPPPVADIMTSLINEISSLPGKITLVLDDYHLIREPLIDESLIFLLEHQPQNFHLIIATRDDPQLPLAGLRAKSQLAELRAADLRFSSTETADFLNKVMGLALSSDDIDALESRTEGWIAGLQLAAISLQGLDDPGNHIKSFTGSHRFVLDYLIEEVLEKQSESVQRFLLETAILDRMTGSLCDALTGEQNGRKTLEMLDNENLFIVPLDNERRWYRYHHLFADLLRQRLNQTQQKQLPILHRSASEWYEQNGFVDEAIEYALRAEDFEKAAHMIEKRADAIWEHGEHTKLRRWLDKLPEEMLSSNPQLSIFHAWDLFASGQKDAVERTLQVAEQTLSISLELASETASTKRDQLPDSDRMKIQGRASAIRAFLASHRGDIPGIIQYARQALEYLPEQDFAWRSAAAIVIGDAHGIKGEMTAAYQARLEVLETSKVSGNIYLSMIANLKLTLVLRMQGHLQRSIDIYQQQMQFANKSGLSQTVVYGGLLATWGEVLAELNNLNEALHQAKKGIELTKHGGDVVMLYWSYLCMTRVLFSSGDFTDAEKIIQKMDNLTREHHIPSIIVNQLAAWRVRIWLSQDKLEAASQWVGECRLNADGDPTYQNEIEYITLARVLIAQGRLDETTTLLSRLLKSAEAGGRISRVIDILLLQALSFQAQRDIDKAIIMLEKALTLAEPGGFIRIFVDEGPPLEALLRKIKVDDGRIKKYIHKLLIAFKNNRTQLSNNGQQPLVEPLSERELEVLHLITEGLTNQQIASRLFLSKNTVKAHIRNIYQKFGVNSRIQALHEARALKILPTN